MNLDDYPLEADWRDDTVVIWLDDGERLFDVELSSAQAYGFQAKVELAADHAAINAGEIEPFGSLENSDTRACACDSHGVATDGGEH